MPFYRRKRTSSDLPPPPPPDESPPALSSSPTPPPLSPRPSAHSSPGHLQRYQRHQAPQIHTPKPSMVAQRPSGNCFGGYQPDSGTPFISVGSRAAISGGSGSGFNQVGNRTASGGGNAYNPAANRTVGGGGTMYNPAANRTASGGGIGSNSVGSRLPSGGHGGGGFNSVGNRTPNGGGSGTGYNSVGNRSANSSISSGDNGQSNANQRVIQGGGVSNSFTVSGGSGHSNDIQRTTQSRGISNSSSIQGRYTGVSTKHGDSMDEVMPLAITSRAHPSSPSSRTQHSTPSSKTFPPSPAFLETSRGGPASMHSTGSSANSSITTYSGGYQHSDHSNVRTRRNGNPRPNLLPPGQTTPGEIDVRGLRTRRPARSPGSLPPTITSGPSGPRPLPPTNRVATPPDTVAAHAISPDPMLPENYAVSCCECSVLSQCKIPEIQLDRWLVMCPAGCGHYLGACVETNGHIYGGHGCKVKIVKKDEEDDKEKKNVAE